MSTSALPFTLARFTAGLGSSFKIMETGLELVLFEASPLDANTPDERRFSLMFRGPAQPALQQATYTLEHPALGAFAIFLVPVGRDAAGMQYQAIFN